MSAVWADVPSLRKRTTSLAVAPSFKYITQYIVTGHVSGGTRGPCLKHLETPTHLVVFFVYFFLVNVLNRGQTIKMLVLSLGKHGSSHVLCLNCFKLSQEDYRKTSRLFPGRN